MYDKHPDVTDEELGIGVSATSRAKAVERAIQLLRHGMGETWSHLAEDEIVELEWVLGEVWESVTRAHWEELRFGSVSLRDVIIILALGGQIREHIGNSAENLRKIDAIIAARSAQPPEPSGTEPR
jgi:hypothetical protein